MNYTHLQDEIRASMPPAPKSLDLTYKIDFEIKRSLGKKLARIRFATVACAVAATCLMFAVPKALAQRQLNHLIDEMNSHPNVLISQYMVSPQGVSTLTSTVTIANGVSELKNAGGRPISYLFNGKSYVLNEPLGHFVVSEGKYSSQPRLDTFVRRLETSPLQQMLSVEDVEFQGMPAKKFTSETIDSGLQTVVIADPETSLPHEMRFEKEVRGTWWDEIVSKFDYSAKSDPIGPDLTKYPPIPESEVDQAYAEAFFGPHFAPNTKPKEFQLLKVDCSDDGTVFVAYQSKDFVQGFWRAYATSLSDNLGTTYIRVGQTRSIDLKVGSKPAVVQMEIYTPLTRVPAKMPRKLSITSYVSPDGKLLRVGQPVNGKPVKEVRTSFHFTRAASLPVPSWAQLIENNTVSSIYALPIEIEDARAQALIVHQDYSAAKKSLQRELSLIDRQSKEELIQTNREDVEIQLQEPRIANS